MVIREGRVELKQAPVSVTLPLGRERAHALAVARDPKRHLMLRIEGIAVAGDVGVWEVRIGDTVAGTLATYGAEEAKGKYVAAVQPDDAFAAYVRPNVKNLTAASPIIVSYKKGIAAMQALPATNPLNWNAWANIHGIGPAPPSGSNSLWNTCQHGHWWFLPWHRMYLWYFEQA